MFLRPVLLFLRSICCPYFHAINSDNVMIILLCSIASVSLNLDKQFFLPSISTPDPCSLKVACRVASETSWFRSGGSFKSPMLQLHKEIFDFSEFISLTPEEQTKCDAAVDRVFEVVKYIWPHCRVEVFGSFKTGLYLPTSDINGVILKSKVGTPQSDLYALAKAFSQKGIAKNIQVIPKVRLPILKFIEKESQIAFDLSFDIDSGTKAVDFIKDVVKAAYRRYNAYLESFGSAEGYLKKIVESELGNKLKESSIYVSGLDKGIGKDYLIKFYSMGGEIETWSKVSMDVILDQEDKVMRKTLMGREKDMGGEKVLQMVFGRKQRVVAKSGSKIHAG